MSNIRTSPANIKIGLPCPRSRLHPKVMGILGLQPFESMSRLAYKGTRITVVFVRGWDLPALVEAGRLDVAICGFDIIEELSCKVAIEKTFEELRFPLALCKRRNVSLDKTAELILGTEYPRLAERLLSRHWGKLTIVPVRGAVEALAHLDGINAIFDIVETGKTIAANDLEIIETPFYTFPCIIRNQQISLPADLLQAEGMSSNVDEAIRKHLHGY
jgi:ATP phosphoribosyltransferase